MIDIKTMEKEAVWWCVGLVCFGIFNCLIFMLRSYSFGVLGEKLTCRLRMMCFNSYMKQEVGYFEFDENDTGAITSRLAQDVKIKIILVILCKKSYR